MNLMKSSLAGIRLPDVELSGELCLGSELCGVVMFVHGSGSSRHSPRNRYVAETLQLRGFGTLLFDLLTEQEDRIYENRFDIERLTQRLLGVTAWLRRQAAVATQPLSYFGASTGAAAALMAAAEPENDVAAVVSRGGRPDLAMARLPEVRAPTLLIVGGNDPDVLELNQRAAAALVSVHRLAVIPGASHLFEEPGTLERVADLAGDWFVQHGSRRNGAGHGRG
jgi:putative phosphoribosyl transferase